MSQINVNNYEAYWLDFLEGQLSIEDQAEFILFASKHPELEIDLDETLLTLDKELNNSPLEDADKRNLKELAELEELIILDQDDELENKMRLSELQSLYGDIASSLQNDYQKSKLKSVKISFPNKSNLKQPIVIPMYWKVAVAAAIAVLIITFFPWQFSPNDATALEEPEIKNSIQPIGPASKLTYKSFDFSNSSNIYSSIKPNFVAKSPKDSTDLKMEQSPSIEPVNQFIVQDSMPITIADQQQVAQENDTIPAKEDDFDLASIPNKNASPKNLTMLEFLAEKVLKVEHKEEEPLIASILDQKTNWDVNFDASESNTKKVTQFKVGKFEFYKSTSK